MNNVCRCDKHKAGHLHPDDKRLSRKEVRVSEMPSQIPKDRKGDRRRTERCRQCVRLFQPIQKQSRMKTSHHTLFPGIMSRRPDETPRLTEKVQRIRRFTTQRMRLIQRLSERHTSAFRTVLYRLRVATRGLGVVPQISCDVPQMLRVVPHALRLVPQMLRVVQRKSGVVPRTSGVVPRKSRVVPHILCVVPRNRCVIRQK